MRKLTAFSAIVGAFLLSAVLSALTCTAESTILNTIEIGGHVQQTRTLTSQDLQKLPQTSVSVSFNTAHGTEAATYTGALLWTVLSAVQFADGPQKNAKLQHKILVTGRDGYTIAVSIGEIDPDFEGKTIILATAKDGKPIAAADGIRLIVPNDKHGGRAVRDVVSLRIE